MVAVVAAPELHKYWVALEVTVKVVLAPEQIVRLLTDTVGEPYTSILRVAVLVQPPPAPVTVTV